jgi:hypothetical protein
VVLWDALIGKYPNALERNPLIAKTTTNPARLVVREEAFAPPEAPLPIITNAPGHGAVNNGVVTLMVVPVV